jgi:hypothetical protein
MAHTALRAGQAFHNFAFAPKSSARKLPACGLPLRLLKQASRLFQSFAQKITSQNFYFQITFYF